MRKNQLAYNSYADDTQIYLALSYLRLFYFLLMRYINTLLKKTIEPYPKQNVMGLMVIMGIVLVLMEAIMVSTGM